MRLQQRLAEWRGEVREHVSRLDADLGAAPRRAEGETTVLPPTPEPRAPRRRRPAPSAPRVRRRGETETDLRAEPRRPAKRARKPAEVISTTRARGPVAIAKPLAVPSIAGGALAAAVAAAYVWLAV